MADMSDLKERLRSRPHHRDQGPRRGCASSTLRMVLTSITNAEVAGKESRELTDEDVLGVLTSESKKRREAAEAFADAGRDEQAAKETAEAAVIADYLPEQLSTEGDRRPRHRDHRRARRPRRRHEAMGRVMGVLTPQTKGRADGGAVAAAVRRQLGLSLTGSAGRGQRRRRATGAARRAPGSLGHRCLAACRPAVADRRR